MGGLSSALAPLGDTSGGSGGSAPQEAVLTDALGMTYRLAVVRARPATASDSIHVAPALSALRGIVLLEHLAVHHSQVTNAKLQLSAQDVVAMASRLYPAQPVLLSQGIGVQPVQQAQLAITVIERLGIAPHMAPVMLYGGSIADSVRVADALVKFIGAVATDSVDMLDITTEVAGHGMQLSDGIGIAAVVNPQLILKVVVTDRVDIDALDDPMMLFDASLSEDIQLSAAYITSGSITTWVINTKTAAVSEYTNYAFNSFAKLGAAYLGASDSGLYELVGDDDDGTDIIAQIKSGFAQWASTKLTGFKGAYLGVRGGGDYVLKLETGDGNTYTYAVPAKDMATTKIVLGKGLRARYFAFELISTGQDFDLDTIEFVPLVSERRV